MRKRHATRTVIGVDVGRRTVKAAQLSVGEGRYRIEALSLLPRPEPEKEFLVQEAQLLPAVLARQGFRGREIVLAAPDERLLRAALELPARVSGAPAEQVIRMELSRLHNVAPDSFEMAYWELKATGPNKPVTQTLAVGCPHEAANAWLDVFEEAGFHVVALDVRHAAAARACRPQLLPAPEITALLDLGWRSSWLLFTCGPSLVYERSLEGAAMAELAERLVEAFALPHESAREIVGTVGLGTDNLAGQFDRETLEAIRKHLRAHFDKALDQLQVPLSYAHHHFPGEGVKRLLLLGGGAAVPQLAPYCERRLGIEVRTAGPCDLTESAPELLAKARNPALTVAVGLAQSEEA
jgi:type IV pilus assembly protein PilM